MQSGKDFSPAPIAASTISPERSSSTEVSVAIVVVMRRLDQHQRDLFRRPPRGTHSSPFSQNTIWRRIPRAEGAAQSGAGSANGDSTARNSSPKWRGKDLYEILYEILMKYFIL